MIHDEITLTVRGGKGGDGGLSFRHESAAPLGGPDGGNGGKGGDVVMEADENLNTLNHLRHIGVVAAKPGERGGPSNCTGKSGADAVIRVPVGTLVFDVRHEKPLKDLDRHGQRVVLARGTPGGRGNRAYRTSTYQTPRKFDTPEPGEERRVRLELKMIADAGLVGLPNAGKSTLLARLSAATPRIAAYPFTTLRPNLGVVERPDYSTFVLADLPGMIDGAHAGTGLGDRFLRHAERTGVLIHLVDVSTDAMKPPDEAYQTIRREIAAYSAELAAKREIVVATKIDLPGAAKGLRTLKRAAGAAVLSVSAATGRGLAPLKTRIFKLLSVLE